MRGASGQLTAETLPFFEQILEHALENHACDTNGVKKHQQRHPRSAETLVHRHLLSGGDSEGNGLRIAVQQIHVARASRQRSGRFYAIADVLNAVRSIARDDFAIRLVGESERGNAVVLAVENSSLAIRGRSGEPAEPSPKIVVTFVEQADDCRTISSLDCPAQIGKGKSVDLQHDQPALAVVLPFFLS